MARFFPIELSFNIHIDRLSAQILISKIIKLVLTTLHLLWIKRCEIVHCTLDGETNINDVLDLRAEVNEILNDPDYNPFLPSSMLEINPEKMDASELRAWLFETYTICKDKEAYTALNEKVQSSYNFSQSILRDDTFQLRHSTFRQREAWFRESSNF